MEQTGFDPKRRLCPDGSCVGIISPDGRCTVCARTASAAAAGQEPQSADGDHPGEPWVDDASPGPASGGDVDAGLEASGFDPHRRLCEDGSCVGVIGPDGACTVCGLKAGG